MNRESARTHDPALEELLAEPWRFEFPQAIRILLRHSQHGETALPVDRRYDVTREPVRIGVHQSLGFPPSDIQSLDLESLTAINPDERVKMLINCFGLTGPSGVLPLAYTEFLTSLRDDSAAAFLDIFNHRLSMLFYYAWEKYRFPVVQESRPDHDLFTQMLLSLAGLGTEHLKRRQFTPDAVFARYAAILAIQPRSACSLETMLGDFFQVPVEVQQFAGSWYKLDENSTTCFREGDSESERLGYGVVVSDEYWSQEFMVRLRIGPLDLETYKRFLPARGQKVAQSRGGPNLKLVEEICRFFSRDELVFEVQLILRRDQVPDARLSVDEGPDDSRLGWTTWAKSVPLEKDAENVVIRLS
jgi:type VI secretion system protein ImpH